MKKKYYLRGLGIGILITALVFSFISPSEMTEEEIIKRAEELGYVKAEETPGINLKDLMETGTPAPSEEPKATGYPSEAPENTPVPTEGPSSTPIPEIIPEFTPEPTEALATPTVTPTLTPTLMPTLTPTPTLAPQDTVIVVEITVERGNTAMVVSDKLKAAGIIENPNELTEYLIMNNLTDDIMVGTYTLSSNMTYAEIADVLTELAE